MYDTYIDNGATGTNFHRPGFQQMLSDIEAGHINCVIVKDLSRLGRNSIDTGYYIEQYFHAHNVRFIAVTDQFDTADSGNLHGGIRSSAMSCLMQFRNTENRSVKKAKQLQNAPTRQTFSKAKCSVLIVAEAFTGNVPSAGKAPILIGSTALQTAG